MSDELQKQVEECARAHQALASEYEAGCNTAGAMELRRVSNLLFALAQGQPWLTVLPRMGEPTRIDETTQVWWHGCWGEPGHFLFSRSGRSVRYEDAPPCAWHGWWLDSGWAPRRRGDGRVTFACSGANDQEKRDISYRTEECDQGEFLVHRVLNGQYTIMAWWDRTQGDSRGACNSCYIVQGVPSVDDLLAWFPKHFPMQAKRLADAGVTLRPAR